MKFVLHIKDSTGSLKYIIDTISFQCGVLWSGSVLTKCFEAYFPIFKVDNPNKSIESCDGHIHKKQPHCIELPYDEYASAMEIIFPEKCSNEDKYLITMAALSIDYIIYEENPFDVESEVNLEG